MDKAKLVFTLPEDKVVKYNGVEIKITPFLTMEEQIYLVRQYLDDYFGINEDSLVPFSEYNFIEAEFKMKNYILQLITNVDTDNIDNNIYADPKFWRVISKNINNYKQFMNTLAVIVEEVKEQFVLKNSVGKVILDLIEKAYSVLDKFSEMTPEDLEKIQKQGVELIERLEKSSVLGTPQED
jgi:hypothetical protein